MHLNLTGSTRDTDTHNIVLTPGMAEFKPDVVNFTPTFHRDTYPFISPTKFDLTGLSVLITGASRGIGTAIAQSFAAAGASHIAIAARAPPNAVAESLIVTAKSASRKPPQVLPLAIDVTSKSSVNAAVKAVTTYFGRLDVLVNNAGYLEERGRIGEIDPDEWWKTLTVNLNGPFLLSRAFLPLLLSTENGLKTILNTTSFAALLTKPGASAYHTSKFALLRLTEFMETDYGEQGLLCITFHPGGVMTEMAKRLPKDMNDKLQDKVELAGDTAVWLTGERREWLQGRYVGVNWDMEELEKDKDRIVEGDLLKMRLAV